MKTKRYIFFAVLIIFGLGFAFPQSSPASEKSPKGYIEMPPAKDGSYILGGRPGDNRRWGRPETIKMLKLVAQEWHRRHGGKYKIRIGDISKKDGSHFPPHKTHKDGLRIDITTRPNICDVNFKNQKLTLELARLFVRFGAWRIFYNDPYVTSRMPEVRKLVKHDTHFHVEINPKKVPKGGGPFLIASPPVTENSWVGGKDLKKTEEGWKGLKLSWNYLGTNPRWQKTYKVELADSSGKILFETEEKRSRYTAIALPFALQDGMTYKWRVKTKGVTGKELNTGWIKFHTDFSPPQVKAKYPLKKDKTDSLPTFKWTYQDDGGKQDSFVIEIDTNSSHSRVTYRSPKQNTSKTEYTLTVQLRPRRSYYWRVVAWDGRGNVAASKWTKFKVTKREKFKVKVATVTARTLNVRGGPGTNHRVIGRVRKGQKVYLMKKYGEWYKIRYAQGRKAREGFVHGNYVKIQ